MKILSSRTTLSKANFQALEQITDTLTSKLCKSVTSETCSGAKQDLAFVVDSSTSIDFSDYEKVKTWMKTITEGFDIGPSGSRISILQFSGRHARPQATSDGDWIDKVMDYKAEF